MALSAKQLGNLADKYADAKKLLTKANAGLKAVKEKKSALWNQLKDAIIAAGTDGAVGKKVKVEIVNKREYVVEDQEAFLKYVLKNKAWDLLPKSIPQEAVRARFEDKVKIPGVGVSEYVDLSVRSR